MLMAPSVDEFGVAHRPAETMPEPGGEAGGLADSIAEMAPVTVARRRISHVAPTRFPPATGAFCALLVVGGVLLLYTGRHLTFFYDEWTFVFTRRGGGLHTFLDPHNGHLVLFPVIVYKALLATVGLRHYFPYQLVSVTLHLLCCSLLYVLVRRRVGPWLALAAVAVLLFMGSAWQVLLWPFQIGYLASVAGGLGAFLLLERPRPQRDAFASALLAWSVVSSGVGVAFIIGAAVLLVTQRAPWRRLWVPAVPLLLFAIWYAGWGGGEHATTDAVLAAPQYVADAAAGATAGLAGLDPAAWGPALTIGLIAAVLLRLRGELSFGSHPLLFAAVAGALTFWGLAAVTRADSPDPQASRYLYVGAVFILLVLAEAGRGLTVRTGTLAVVAVLVAAGVASNLHVLRGGERGLRASDESVRTALGSVEIAAPVVSPAFQPDPQNAPQVTAGPYLTAVRDLGSPALTPRQLLASSASTRADADAVLIRAEALTLRPGAPAHVSGCVVLRPRLSGEGILEETLGPGRSLFIRSVSGRSSGVSAPAHVYVRRIAPVFPPLPIGSITDGSSVTLAFSKDVGPALPWHVRLVSPHALRACVS